MADLACATKVFKRTDHLERLLESVEAAGIERMYVADDGEPGEHDRIYDRDWAFDLEVIDLEFDAGLGLGRKRFVEASEEEYLLVVDTDHEVPANYGILREVLETYPEVGGVAGIELERGRIAGMCHDIAVEDGVLIRYAPSGEYEWESGYAFRRFDFVPNAALFRRDCVEAYNWDPEYVIAKEHLDFYYGHYVRTDWEFGICPTVAFPHHETSDSGYLQLRTSETRQMRSKRYFLDKWGVEQIHRRSYWLDATPHDDPIVTRIADRLPIAGTKLVHDANDEYRTLKGRFAEFVD